MSRIGQILHDTSGYMHAVLEAGTALIGDVKTRARRSTAITTLVNAQVFDDTQTSYNSANVDCDDHKHFLLHLDVDSTGTGDHIIQFVPQFSDDGGTTWYSYKQGLFASLFYEDVDTASGIKECFSGDVAGRDMRLRVVATDTSATLKFTVTVKVEFYA